MIASLPNSHEALLRNLDALSGRLALIGLSDERLPGLLADGGLAVTDHYGLWQRLQSQPGWTAIFGYDDDNLGHGTGDTAVVFLPKARPELTLRLALARHLLGDGGRVLLIGEKREGIAGAVKQLRIEDAGARKLDSARHCQVWQARLAPADAGFDPAQWLDWHTVDMAGTSVKVANLPGIFSAGHLDAGTRVLLEALAGANLSGPVLDFACGAGTIGAWLHAHTGGALSADGIDVQAQAVYCARRTYERAGVSGHITAADGLPDGLGQYATVITNPPFHTGVQTDTTMTARFLQGISRHLAPGGQLLLVANAFLPYRDLMEQHIGPCQVLAGDRKFTVYRASLPAGRRRGAI
ncbi:methyltransferase [Marinobacter salicampi]|uniref:methyltransferase n=1 Tax=Marinobacter salicampi TaxID=435907 RepID=UPI00140C26F2